MLDFFIGDPESLPHPVVGMGRWVGYWEKRLNAGSHRKAKGALLVVISLLLCYLLTFALLRLCRHVTPTPYGSPLTITLSAVLIFYCLAGHTLRREVRLVFEALDRSLDDGRRQVARIVGRDTQTLSAQEVRTAALETLAENLSDGVITPLFWLGIAGVPGMLTYKFVNTFDSMIGYRNARYKDFGCWAARIDDIVNFIPARLTALLILLASTLSTKRGIRQLTSNVRFVLHYGPKHASPNSGWPEAAMAACLDCRFGGTHVYFGEEVYKPYIGSNPRPLTSHDMQSAIRIGLTAELLGLGLLLIALISFHP